MIDPTSVPMQSARLNFSEWSRHGGLAVRLAMGLVAALLVALVLTAAEFRFSTTSSLSEVEAAAATSAVERLTLR